MATLLDLISGSQEVLPIIFDNFRSGSLKIDQLKIINSLGVKTKQFNAVVRSSTGRKAYITNMMFAHLDDPEKEKPKVSKTRVLVRCSCQAYYFWFIYANKLAKAQTGGKFRVYVRKTPPPPEGLPYKNPDNVPGICKHILLLSEVLQQRNLIV